MAAKKGFLIGALFGLILLFVYIYSQPDGKLHLVFCDVGQGDAIFIKTPDNHDLLIDGGPNERVLQCLGDNMPFYDRTIDMVVLTHPQKDHLQGLLSVIDRYSIKYFVSVPVGNTSQGFSELKKKIEAKGIPVKNLYQGDNFSMGEVKFNVLWPEREWTNEKLGNNILLAGNSSNVLGISAESADLNSFSIVLYLNYRQFDTLLTGDSDSKIQPEIIRTAKIPDVEILKFPHHGSKTGITREFLEEIRPELTIISVGKNPWGHPTKEALAQLEAIKSQVARTDQRGEIEVISDGKSWSIDK